MKTHSSFACLMKLKCPWTSMMRTSNPVHLWQAITVFSPSTTTSVLLSRPAHCLSPRRAKREEESLFFLEPTPIGPGATIVPRPMTQRSSSRNNIFMWDEEDDEDGLHYISSLHQKKPIMSPIIWDNDDNSILSFFNTAARNKRYLACSLSWAWNSRMMLTALIIWIPPPVFLRRMGTKEGYSCGRAGASSLPRATAKTTTASPTMSATAAWRIVLFSSAILLFPVDFHLHRQQYP